jgi:hypothetical protein
MLMAPQQRVGIAELTQLGALSDAPGEVDIIKIRNVKTSENARDILTGNPG